MTSTTLYQASIPVVRRGLSSLDACLAKAAAHFAEAGVAETDWLTAALAPDMFSLTRQIQAASDAARNIAALLSGGEVPAIPDVETSVAELRARIDKTIAYLDSVPPAAIEGREDIEIIRKLPKVNIRFTGASYLRDFGMANFFFHTAIAYGIMRHKGAPLGKLDYLGPQDMTLAE